MDSLAIFVTLTFCITVLTLCYPSRLIFTSHRPDLPGPHGIPLFGNLFQFYPWREKGVQWICHLMEQFNDLASVTMPPWGRAIIIGRPEWLAHIKTVDLVKYQRGPHEVAVFTEFPGRRIPLTSNGSEWRLYRRVMGPVFTARSIDDHVRPAISKIMAFTSDLLTTLSATETPVDWNDLSGRISLSVLCFSSLSLDTGLLSADPECLKQSDKFRDSLVTLNGLSSRRLMNPFWRWSEKLTGADKKFEEARQYIFKVIDDIVNSRKEELEKSPTEVTADYVSQLLTSEESQDPLLIRDMLVTILFAGRDNTHNSLNWSMHLLLQHPEWMEKMREEAIRLRRGNGSTLPFTKLGEYHIHQAVFYEVTRLWPGIPKNLRLAMSDDILPALPEANLPAVSVRKGDYILWSDYHMMRHPAIWGADASLFNPGRHLDPDGRFVKPKSPAFNGFGHGPRFCPAAPLVTYEFVSIWSSLLPQFEFVAKYRGEPIMIEAFTPVIGEPLPVGVRLRD